MASDAENVIPVDDEGWETVVEEFGANWAPDSPDDPTAVLTGVFEGSKYVTQEDLNTGDDREALVYSVRDNSGKLWSVWSSHNIDLGFQDTAVGQEVRIQYLGKESLSGGRTVKVYRFARRNLK